MMSLKTQTNFEIFVFCQQPETLQQACAKRLAAVAMQNDELGNSHPLSVQDKIAAYLTGKWFLQYLKRNGQNLITLEQNVVERDYDERSHFLHILCRFFKEEGEKRTFDSDSLSCLLECYVSQACLLEQNDAVKLYQLGMTRNVPVWVGDGKDYVREYIASDQDNFTPTFVPLSIPSEFTTYKCQESIYNSEGIFPAFPIDYFSKSKRNEVPHRLCWAKHFILQERLPEALCQLLPSFNVIDEEIHSHCEHLELFALLLFVFARLQINIKSCSAVIEKMLTLVKYDFNKARFAGPLTAFFVELGDFKWAENVFLKFLDKNKKSSFYVSAVVIYVEGLFEQVENICFYIITVREYHKFCTRKFCLREKEQGVLLMKLENLLKKAENYLREVPCSSTYYYLLINFKMLKALFFKFSKHQEKDYFKSWMMSLRGDFESYCLRRRYPRGQNEQVAILKMIFDEMGYILFEETIPQKFKNVTVANLSSFKIKTQIRAMSCLLLFHNPDYDTSQVRANVCYILQETVSDLGPFSNGKSYRSRLLNLMAKVFVDRKIHPREMLYMTEAMTKIPNSKARHLENVISPNLDRFSLEKNDTKKFRNDPCVSREGLPNYTNYPLLVQHLILCDPYLKQHIEFGIAQTKFHKKFLPGITPAVNYRRRDTIIF